MSSQHSGALVRHSLLPHQEKFIGAYFSNQGDKFHCLVAPVGSGLTKTLSELTRALFEKKSSSRVLFLVNRMELVSHFTQTLGCSGLPAVALDRFKYREIEDSGDFGTLLNIKEGIYVSTIQFALQRDVCDSLHSITWDLVIVDSNHFRIDTRYGEFLSKLLNRGEVLSAIVTVNVLSRDILACLPESVAVTEWKLKDLVSRTGEQLWRPWKARLELITYQLTSGERDIRQILNKISSLTQAFETNENKATELLPLRFSSDPYNIEIRLRSLHSSIREIRNRATHGLNVDLPVGITIANLEEVLLAIERAFSMLDSQEVDSKLEALTNEIRNRQTGRMKIVITTTYRATSEYLTSSLQPDFDRPSLLTASVPPDEIKNLINSFNENGGTLITTEAILKGMEFADVDIFVPYEAPRNAQKALALLGRFLRISRDKHLTVLGLEEEGGDSSEVDVEASAVRQALQELGLDS